TSSLTQMYCCLSRDPQVLCSRLNEIARLASVAEKSFTGIETIPNETVSVAIDRAAMAYSPGRGSIIVNSQLRCASTGSQWIFLQLYAFARATARSRLCLRVNASRQRSPVWASRSTAFVILKSSGCALASSSQVSGIDTGAPAAPLGE